MVWFRRGRVFGAHHRGAVFGHQRCCPAAVAVCDDEACLQSHRQGIHALSLLLHLRCGSLPAATWHSHHAPLAAPCIAALPRSSRQRALRWTPQPPGAVCGGSQQSPASACCAVTPKTNFSFLASCLDSAGGQALAVQQPIAWQQHRRACLMQSLSTDQQLSTESQHMWCSCACLLEAGLWDWSVSLRRRPRDAVEGSPCCRLACCMCGCSARHWHVSHDAAGPTGCRPRRLLGRTEPQQHMTSRLRDANPAAGLTGRAVGRLPSASSPENAGEGDAAMLVMDSVVNEHPSQPAGQ